jgi:hypothetical protein
VLGSSHLEYPFLALTQNPLRHPGLTNKDARRGPWYNRTLYSDLSAEGGSAQRADTLFDIVNAASNVAPTAALCLLHCIADPAQTGRKKSRGREELDRRA